jgi:gamma-glutamylcyclotransferase (GGCT)/AIG2-like uncharacterized protein YtfP
MRSILDEIDISNLKGIDKIILPLWVYATLRTGKRFHYYLVDCSAKVGEYQMDGTLMQMVSGDVFVCKDGSGRQTTGELYRVSLAGLWRIFIWKTSHVGYAVRTINRQKVRTAYPTRLCLLMISSINWGERHSPVGRNKPVRAAARIGVSGKTLREWLEKPAIAHELTR